METKKEIVARALQAQSNRGSYTFSEVPINLGVIVQAANHIASVQKRIVEIITADDGMGLKRAAARVKMRLRPRAYDLETIMISQSVAILFVEEGIKSIEERIEKAVNTAENYWLKTKKVPEEMELKEKEMLTEIASLTIEKQGLEQESYDKHEQATQYYEHIAKLCEVNRKLDSLLLEQARLHESIMEIEPQIGQLDTLLRYLDDQKRKVREWYEPIHETKEKLKLASAILPALAKGGKALAEYVELSDSIIANTRQLTSHEFRKSYATIEALGSPGKGILEGLGRYPTTIPVE